MSPPWVIEAPQWWAQQQSPQSQINHPQCTSASKIWWYSWGHKSCFSGTGREKKPLSLPCIVTAASLRPIPPPFKLNVNFSALSFFLFCFLQLPFVLTQREESTKISQQEENYKEFVVSGFQGWVDGRMFYSLGGRKNPVESKLGDKMDSQSVWIPNQGANDMSNEGCYLL